MKISVIIPVFNNSEQLEKCLFALNEAADLDTEIILVDDASEDDSADISAKFNIKTNRLKENSGPAFARNFGAEIASGEILFFIDSDVVVKKDSIKKVRNIFIKDQTVSALFGSYDDEPADKAFLSQYRNLLHHFFHQHNSINAETFWAGCGAIRKDIFLSLGGFNDKRFLKPQIEDIELGYRLRDENNKILLLKDLQVKHLKKWTLGGMLKTDIFDRAIPWTRLLLENPQRTHDLNINNSQKISAVLCWLGIFLLPFSYIINWTFILSAIIPFLLVIFLNRVLSKFFLQKKGLVFTIKAFFFQVLYYLYSSAAYVFVYADFLISGFRTDNVKNIKTR